jgi:hypothetical protein
MRTFIVFILSCASVLGADTGIQIFTSAKTNAETASIYTTDVFTRDGQTNLVRTAKTKAGVLQIRIQKFYHGGVFIGDYVAMKDSSGFTTEAGIPYLVSFEFWPSKEIRSAVIGTKDGVILDWFTCTNGVFSPVESARIAKANAFDEDLRPLFSPSHVTNTPPGVFGQEVEQFIEKHKKQGY